MLDGPVAGFSCLVGTMVQEVFDTHPDLRVACREQMDVQLRELGTYVAAAKRRYAPRARLTAESLALHVQGVIQGALILAKARQSLEVAIECLRHLLRYLEMLFGKDS